MRKLPHLLAGALLLAALAPAGANAAGCAVGRPTARTMCLLNAERHAHGLPVLHHDPRLALAAREHSADMVARRYFAHVSPEGNGPADRIAATGWMRGRASWSIGEDLGWGTGLRGRPQAIVAAWMASPPHRHTILTRRFRAIGIGIAAGVPVRGASGGGTYPADFGTGTTRPRRL
jgi:uncharacterized protein YkwD